MDGPYRLTTRKTTKDRIKGHWYYYYSKGELELGHWNGKRINNKERKRKYDKEYVEKNKKKITKRDKDYREKNKEKLSHKKKEYYKKNKGQLNIYNREWREKNKEKLSHKNKEYYEKNKEQQKEKSRKYHEAHKNNTTYQQNRKAYTEKNREKTKKRAKEYYETNKNGKVKEYREKNREKILMGGRRYSKVNRDKINKKARERYHRDEDYRLEQILRSGLLQTLKVQGASKNARTIEYSRCSVAFLYAHLEKQFTDGMTWENRGEWHIDHRRPRASFNLNNDDEIYMCQHYTNLQPMWGPENMAKGKYYDPETFEYEWKGRVIGWRPKIQNIEDLFHLKN